MPFLTPMERVKQLIDEKKKIEDKLEGNKPISMKELGELQKQRQALMEDIKKLEQRTQIKNPR